MTALNRSAKTEVSPAVPGGSIDRVIVRLGTWGATVFLVLTIVAALAAGDPTQIAQAAVPASIAGLGWFMLWRDEPRAVPQLVIGMFAVVGAVTFAPDIIGGDPLLGVLVMSIVGTVLTRRRYVAFGAVAVVALAVTSVASEPAATPQADQVINAGVAIIAYAITSWLLVYLKRSSNRHQRQLESLIESKDQFVATVSHELRTPLTTIVGLALELDERYEDFRDDEIQDFISLLVTEGTDVANIVEDLLVAARADIGTLALTCTWLSLEDELAAATGDTNQVAVDSAGLPGGASVYADGLRFRQIVRNLVANAARYGGEEVRMVLRGEVDTVLIEVRDTGTAIPADEQELIFESYHSSARSGALPGSAGLGLTVSRRLARLMEGELTYHHDGHESVFTLRLPASFAEPRYAAAGT